MVEKIGNDIIRDLIRAVGERRKRVSSPGGGSSPDVRDVITTELDELLERVKAADVVRKDQVHRVIDRLRNDELVTSESVREAAERMIEKGI